MLVLVVSAALQPLNASTLKFFQCLLAIIDPLLNVMKAIALALEKFGIDILPLTG